MAKVIISDPNVANNIACHLSANYIDLVSYAVINDGIWFTGSQVWTNLYPLNALAKPFLNGGSDLDIFCIGDKYNSSYTVRNNFIAKCGLIAGPVKGLSTKYGGTGNGTVYNSKYGPVDLWDSDEDVVDMLLRYPDASNAHCRTAYSFTKGLVILPNSAGW